MHIAIAILIVATIDAVIQVVTYRKYVKDLEEREKTVARIERLYAGALVMIKQQTKEAEHLLKRSEIAIFCNE